MALCGVEMNIQTDGNNMVPLLHDKQTTRWKDAAWSYFNRGITVRTESYRLTKYSRSAAPVIELFDHRADGLENQNIAAAHPETVHDLLPLLEEKFFEIGRASCRERVCQYG